MTEDDEHHADGEGFDFPPPTVEHPPEAGETEPPDEMLVDEQTEKRARRFSLLSLLTTVLALAIGVGIGVAVLQPQLTDAREATSAARREAVREGVRADQAEDAAAAAEGEAEQAAADAESEIAGAQDQASEDIASAEDELDERVEKARAEVATEALQEAQSAVASERAQVEQREAAVAASEAGLASREAAVAQVESATFSDGTYLVGTDVPAGTYVTQGSPSGCYWARLSRDGEDILQNNIGDGQARATIRAGELFESSRCGTWQPG